MLKTGTLVKVSKRFIGVIMEKRVHHNGDWKYFIFFACNGQRTWWTEDFVEELCSK